MNLISYHLRLLRTAALVHERRSAADARDVYYSLDLLHLQTVYTMAVEGMHPALGDSQPVQAQQAAPSNQPPVRILFLCTHNSARSQIAEALMRHLGGAGVEVYSAGTERTRVHPTALTVLQQHNIDTSPLASKTMEQFIGQKFDYSSRFATAPKNPARSSPAHRNAFIGVCPTRPLCLSQPPNCRRLNRPMRNWKNA